MRSCMLYSIRCRLIAICASFSEYKISLRVCGATLARRRTSTFAPPHGRFHPALAAVQAGVGLVSRPQFGGDDKVLVPRNLYVIKTDSVKRAHYPFASLERFAPVPTKWEPGLLFCNMENQAVGDHMQSKQEISKIPTAETRQQFPPDPGKRM